MKRVQFAAVGTPAQVKRQLQEAVAAEILGCGHAGMPPVRCPACQRWYCRPCLDNHGTCD